jgi:hypothetical protein
MNGARLMVLLFIASFGGVGFPRHASADAKGCSIFTGGQASTNPLDGTGRHESLRVRRRRWRR